MHIHVKGFPKMTFMEKFSLTAFAIIWCIFVCCYHYKVVLIMFIFCKRNFVINGFNEFLSSFVVVDKENPHIVILNSSM